MEERRREALRLRERDRAEEAALAAVAWRAAIDGVPDDPWARAWRRLEHEEAGRVSVSQQRTATGSHRG